MIAAAAPARPSPNGRAPVGERLPPHSVELERAAIAALLVGSEQGRILAEGLTADDFWYFKHRLVLGAAKAIAQRGEPVGLVEVGDELQRRGRLDELGGPVGLADLADHANTPDAFNPAGVVRRLRDYAKRRRALALAEELAGAAWDMGRPLDEALAGARLLVAATTLKEGVVVATTWARPIAEVVAAAPDGVSWLPLLGQPGLVGPGLCTLLSGRPKSGKTTLVAHAVAAWLASGKRVLWLTEEPSQAWRERIDVLPGLLSDALLVARPDGADAEEVATRVRAPAPDVVIVDTARAFLGIADENDAAIVQRKVFPLVRAARDCGAALVVLHHLRKSTGDEGTDVAGSHAFVGICDVAVSLKEAPDQPRRRLLETRSRFDATPPKLMAELAEDGLYRVLGQPFAVALAEVKRRVLAVLGPDDGITTKELVEAFDEPRPGREIVRQALHGLAAEGMVERIPGAGRRADAWRLVVATTTPSLSVVATTSGDPPGDAPVAPPPEHAAWLDPDDEPGVPATGRPATGARVCPAHGGAPAADDG